MYIVVRMILIHFEFLIFLFISLSNKKTIILYLHFRRKHEIIMSKIQIWIMCFSRVTDFSYAP